MVLFSAYIFMVSWIDLIDRAITGTGESNSSPSSRLGMDLSSPGVWPVCVRACLAILWKQDHAQ